MLIIRKGVLPIYQGRCSCCGAEVKFAHTEKGVAHITTGGNLVAQIVCPTYQCGGPIVGQIFKRQQREHEHELEIGIPDPPESCG